jgi:hypothetical protein
VLTHSRTPRITQIFVIAKANPVPTQLAYIATQHKGWFNFLNLGLTRIMRQPVAHPSVNLSQSHRIHGFRKHTIGRLKGLIPE